MIELADVIQWAGFVGIVIGYAIFGNRRLQGALWSLFGAAALIWWCALQTKMPWGVFTLQATFVAINARYIWNEVRSKC